jgi:cytoskeletal protein CcmA (bactofilin family)
MFGKKEDAVQNSIANLQSLNSIGVGTIIDGNIKTDGDFRIDGKVNGNIFTSGRLVLGASSQVVGDINCINGNIEGFVRGNIQVKEILKISKSANVDGNITTNKLIVEEGAVIQAKISMSSNKSVVNQPIHPTPNK